MTYTSHGHWIGPGEPSIPRPLMARCGGLFGCTQCRNEAAEVLVAWMSTPDWPDTTRSGELALNIGEAVDALRAGHSVTRWEDARLVLVPGSNITVSTDRPLGRAVPELVGQDLSYQCHIDKVTNAGTMAPWVVSHRDLLAEDWRLA